MASDLIDLWDERERCSVNFRGGRAKRSTDVFVAVMGVTGSGKSSFIAQCSGEPVRIGHDLNACTAKVDVYAYDMSPHRTVYLIDTPGFDDTMRSDAEVLGEIAAWLGDSYKHKILLNGIIYLHRITDRRMQGSARRNLYLFRELCGEDALKKVILVTTMWDQISNKTGEMREKELIETREFWGWMVGKGSSVYRHDHTQESAASIIHRLANHNEPIATDLQRELVDKRRPLNETSAGRKLQSDLVDERVKLAGMHRETEDRLRLAVQESDSEAEEMLREERDVYESSIKKVEEDINNLRWTVEKLIAQRDEQLQEQHASYQDELERIRIRTERLEVGQEVHELQRDIHPQPQALSLPATPVSSSRSARVESVRLSQEVHNAFENDRQHSSRESQSLLLPKDSPEASVSLWEDLVCIIGNCSINSSEHPKLQLNSNSIYLRKISLGDVADRARSWIARYEETWMTSTNLSLVYPGLAHAISVYGLQQLQSCFLGPDQQFFAKWHNGPEKYFSIHDFSEVLGGRNHVVDVAFGWQHACFVVYMAPGFRHRTQYDLKGYYQDLQYFLDLEENHNLIVLAITLDPGSKTDYVLVYTFPRRLSPKKRYVRYQCSEANSNLMSRFFRNPSP